MRVPGLSSAISFGRSFRFSDGSRYSITTVASLMSVVNRSVSLNVTRRPTPALAALAVASAMRCGSMSMPTPRAPRSRAAAITMRPSPQPRS